MARKWSGFLPQNLNVKEEWELLEACEAKAAVARERRQPAGRTPMRPGDAKGLDTLPSRGRLKH